MRRLRQLEEENRRLKEMGRIRGSIHGRDGKKALRPALKAKMVTEVMATHALSQRRACGLSERIDPPFSKWLHRANQQPSV
jgi:hypothetical protein